MEKLMLQKFKREMIRLDIGTEDTIIWGRTHFGGRPDVPDDFIWPRFSCDTFYDDEVKDRPLTFLAQFDCTALTGLSVNSNHLLPNHGILSFFYELGSARWGLDPNDAGCARVYWFDGNNRLRPTTFPTDLEDDFRLPRLPIQATCESSFPCWEDYIITKKDKSDISQTKFTNDDNRCSKLLGYPDIIHNNMTLTCELVTRGYYLGNDTVIPQFVIDTLGPTSLDEWRLLFQLDSIALEECELYFGDCGALYFYIRESDLRLRRFDRVWTILQC